VPKKLNSRKFDKNEKNGSEAKVDLKLGRYEDTFSSDVEAQLFNAFVNKRVLEVGILLDRRCAYLS
jgi:hypothetical protein